MPHCRHGQLAGSTSIMTRCLASPTGDRSTCSCPYVSVCPATAGYGACRASLICKLHLSFVAEGIAILSGSAPSLGGACTRDGQYPAGVSARGHAWPRAAGKGRRYFFQEAQAHLSWGSLVCPAVVLGAVTQPHAAAACATEGESPLPAAVAGACSKASCSAIKATPHRAVRDGDSTPLSPCDPAIATSMGTAHPSEGCTIPDAWPVQLPTCLLANGQPGSCL